MVLDNIEYLVYKIDLTLTSKKLKHFSDLQNHLNIVCKIVSASIQTVCKHLLGFCKPPQSFICASLFSWIIDSRELLQISHEFLFCNFFAINPEMYTDTSSVYALIRRTNVK